MGPLDTIIWENAIWEYALITGILLFVIILKRRAGKKITRVVFYFFRRMGRVIDEERFLELVLPPLENFIVALTAFILLDELNFPSEFKFKILRVGSDVILERIGICILLFLFFQTLLRVIDYLAVIMEKKANQSRDMTDDQLIIFFREFLKAILIILCILLMIRFVFNQDITKLLAGLSIVGAAIALAAKESIENLIASFIIFFDKPFMVGDLLKVNQITGTVEKIGLRSTRIRSTDKSYVTIPNKQMVDSIVDNLSMRDKRRVEIVLQLDLKTDRSKLDQFMQELRVRLAAPRIQDASVLLSDIRIDSYVVTVEYYTEPIAIGEFNEVKQAVNLSVMDLIETNGISVAGKNRPLSL
ncbi:MAG: mechanosensitive ion channel family protein [Bacteroidetes bacterium]|nr:mechanosensitive ion channel family protein [Bacteroidota bacterium]